NGNEKLFLSDENYRYFLKKYDEYVHPIADTFSYCLMPNHFHFLIRIKEESVLKNFFKKKIEKINFKSDSTLQGFKTLEGFETPEGLDLSKLLSLQFSHLFNGYTQALNKQQGRKGGLFMHPFKRKQITDEIYLRRLVRYIHYNPVESGLARSPEEWEFSSFNTIVVPKEGNGIKIERKEIIGFFGDLDNFKYCHHYST